MGLSRKLTKSILVCPKNVVRSNYRMANIKQKGCCAGVVLVTQCSLFTAEQAVRKCYFSDSLRLVKEERNMSYIHVILISAMLFNSNNDWRICSATQPFEMFGPCLVVTAVMPNRVIGILDITVGLSVLCLSNKNHNGRGSVLL